MDPKFAVESAVELNFFRAIRDEDSFTVLWELAAHSPQPVAFESIRKTFGADPAYVSEVLNRLHRLGVASRAGRQWTVSLWAKSSLEYLQDSMENFRIEVAQPVAMSEGIYATDPAGVATLDGFWIVTTSQAGSQSSSSAATRTATLGDSENRLDSSELIDKPQNEARTHDYK